MGKQYESLSEKLTEFIAEQKIFFVGTATGSSRVNVSPKGMDTLRVLNNNRVIWLNVTGSGNETSAHVQLDPRMTIMFCAFEGQPLILRLYGTVRVIHKKDDDWKDLFLQVLLRSFSSFLEVLIPSCLYQISFGFLKSN